MASPSNQRRAVGFKPRSFRLWSVGCSRVVSSAGRGRLVRCARCSRPWLPSAALLCWQDGPQADLLLRQVLRRALRVPVSAGPRAPQLGRPPARVRPEVGAAVRRELSGGWSGRAPLSSPAQAAPAAALCSVGETAEAGARTGRLLVRSRRLKARPVLGLRRVGLLGSVYLEEIRGGFFCVSFCFCF